MEILKVIARLMDYPNQDIADHKDEICVLIGKAREISPAHRTRLQAIVDETYRGDLMDAEERYTGLFEQGRSLSLHLFEHVHGESRDRGQAMVDLMAEYAKNGLEISSRELPDYIPLFLEYLSSRPDLEAREWLADVSHILALLGARLTERKSSYVCLFESLLLIAGRSDELSEKLREIADEQPDNTREALDEEWEEVAVSFAAEDQACKSDTPAVDPAQARPMVWTDAGAQIPQSRQEL